MRVRVYWFGVTWPGLAVFMGDTVRAGTRAGLGNGCGLAVLTPGALGGAKRFTGCGWFIIGRPAGPPTI